jgi:hypothetical protein
VKIIAYWMYVATLWLVVAITSAMLAVLPKVKPGSDEDYDHLWR